MPSLWPRNTKIQALLLKKTPKDLLHGMCIQTTFLGSDSMNQIIAVLKTPDGLIQISNKETYDIARQLFLKLGRTYYSKDTKNNLKKLEKLFKRVNKAHKALTAPTKRGRPKGSKNKLKKTQTTFKHPNETEGKAEIKKTHYVIKEPYETTQEFAQRKKEELRIG